MAVRAKFHVTGIEDTKDADGAVTARRVTLLPVYSDSEENRTFWEATPSGALEMTITNKQAFEQFERDQVFYIDFTPADE